MVIYDFEVFKDDWLVVLKKSLDDETVIINDAEELINYFEDNKYDVWVGFNNVRYDQYILKAILCGLDPKECSDYMIVDGKPGWKFSDLFYKINTIQYDVMNSLTKGLKVYEGYLGKSIIESSVDFNIDRKLTDDEIEEVVKYCKYDVKSTAELFGACISDFKAHLELVKMIIPIDYKNLSKTKAQLSALILEAKKKDRDDEFDIFLPDNLKLDKYKFVADWYLDRKNKTYKRKRPKKTGEGYVLENNYLEVDVCDVTHVFGWGGLHGAREKYITDGELLFLDVTSMYPSLMIEYDLLSRNCSRRGKLKYKEIYDTRLKLKKEGKKAEQAPLKLVLNSTYGILKDRNNQMYDPLMANMVCVYGQLFTLDLLEKLEGKCEVIQSNTDGVLIKITEDNKRELWDIFKEWMNRTRLKLDFKKYKKIYQKDVNNYLIIDEAGEYKSKGAYVKSLSNLDNDLPIVNKALVNYMLYGDELRDTIYSCEELREFQKVDKVGSKYLYAMHGSNPIRERVIRHFASCDISDGGLFKVKMVNGTERIEKISNSAKRVFIDNGDMDGKKVPSRLDREHYINIAEKRLRDFIGL